MSDLIKRYKWWLFGIILLGGRATWWEQWRSRREHSQDAVILAASRKHAVDPVLVKAVVWRESWFDTNAKGTSGEVGLMQITKDTATIARVSQTVRDRVLGQGQTWLVRAFVVNDWYVWAYEPLLDTAGQRVGMLYVGFLESPFRWVRHAMLAVMGLIFLAVMAVSAWFSVRWARSIFKPVEQMNRTMQRVEDGGAAARVGTLPARDELGALAGHLDQLLDVIDENTAALRRWGEELDQKVAERTRELEESNASLRLAQQQLVKSEKLAAIGQLTASIAHDINNPIAVMGRCAATGALASVGESGAGRAPRL